MPWQRPSLPSLGELFISLWEALGVCVRLMGSQRQEQPPLSFEVRGKRTQGGETRGENPLLRTLSLWRNCYVDTYPGEAGRPFLSGSTHEDLLAELCGRWLLVGWQNGFFVFIADISVLHSHHSKFLGPVLGISLRVWQTRGGKNLC